MDPELAEILADEFRPQEQKRVKRAFVQESSRMWPNTTIYYTYATGANAITAASKAILESTFAYYNQYTCLTYSEFTGTAPVTNYLYVSDEDTSSVGA